MMEFGLILMKIPTVNSMGFWWIGEVGGIHDRGGLPRFHPRVSGRSEIGRRDSLLSFVPFTFLLCKCPPMSNLFTPSFFSPFLPQK